MIEKKEFTLQDILDYGKATKIKNREYYNTASYVTPFIDRMSKFTDEFIVKVKEPDQITVTPDGELVKEDLTFNRVWIQAVLPTEYHFDNHKQVIGMVYGLDVRKPVAKIYQGALNMACTNLSVFNPSFLNVQPIQPESPLDYSCIKWMMERVDDTASKLKQLTETPFETSSRNINENLGKWIRNSIYKSYNNEYGKVKFATSDVIEAYKLLFEDEESPYFVENETNMFNVYNAFTQVITNDNKDIMNHFEKTLVVNQILGI